MQFVFLVIIFCLAFAGTAQAQKTKSVLRDESKYLPLKMTAKESLASAEQLAWDEIQDRIDTMSEGEEANDLNAATEFIAEEFILNELVEKESDRHLKEVKTKVLSRAQIEQYKKQNLASLYSTSDETKTFIENLSIKGNLATVTTNQHYVRTIRGGDGNPHQAITNVRHRETWIYTESGWLQKSIQELERGPTLLDGKPYVE